MNSRKKMMNEPSSEKQRWSLRKISVGMTSVLLGATMFWVSGAGSQVKADTTTDHDCQPASSPDADEYSEKSCRHGKYRADRRQ